MGASNPNPNPCGLSVRQGTYDIVLVRLDDDNRTANTGPTVDAILHINPDAILPSELGWCHELDPHDFR